MNQFCTLYHSVILAVGALGIGMLLPLETKDASTSGIFGALALAKTELRGATVLS